MGRATGWPFKRQGGYRQHAHEWKGGGACHAHEHAHLRQREELCQPRIAVACCTGTHEVATPAIPTHDAPQLLDEYASHLGLSTSRRTDNRPRVERAVEVGADLLRGVHAHVHDRLEGQDGAQSTRSHLRGVGGRAVRCATPRMNTREAPSTVKRCGGVQVLRGGATWRCGALVVGLGDAQHTQRSAGGAAGEQN